MEIKRTLQSLQTDAHRIEYSEGSDPTDLFTEIEILNPENPQHTIYRWVPIELAPSLEAEVDIRRGRFAAIEKDGNTYPDPSDAEYYLINNLYDAREAHPNANIAIEDTDSCIASVYVANNIEYYIQSNGLYVIYS